MTGTDPMRGQRAGNQDHLWTADEINSRTGRHGRRELRRGMRPRRRRRGRG